MKTTPLLQHPQAFLCHLLAALVLTTPALVCCSQTADAFNPNMGGPYASFGCVTVQTDGKVLVGGDFTSLGGQARRHIARLFPDGNLDPSFNPSITGCLSQSYTCGLTCLAVQEDGKILVAGGFTNLCGQPRRGLGRLNSDGSLDGSFDPGVDNFVLSLAVQADGKILMGGRFQTLAGQPRSCIGRLNADGSLDDSFDPGVSGSEVYALALQPDGKILVGGSFSSLSGSARANIGRLNPDGSLDESFNPGTWGAVFSLGVQADGKILVGGSFMTLAGLTRNYIGRLNADGSPDTAFNPGAGGWVHALAVQADGKILVVGEFQTLAGQARSCVGRLNANGTLDYSFNPGTGDSISYPNVFSVALQADGKVLVAGRFTTLGGQPRNGLGRLNNGAATQSLTYAGSTLTWLRGGTSPEVWGTSFDCSTNGTDWFSLGVGQRVTGGWQLEGVFVETGANLRARGFVTDAERPGQFVETIIGPVRVVSQPVSCTNNAGTIATFYAAAGGTPPLAYQWRRHGTNLTNGGNVSGATTPLLRLAGAVSGDAGQYSVVITNSYGSSTSSVAMLTVVDPFIAGEPISQSTNAGQTVIFRVTAVGAPPLNYQWRKGGTNLSNGGGIAGVNTSQLTLTNVLGGAAGGYTVVISNAFGSLTSAVATLTVVDPWISSHPQPGLQTCTPAQTVRLSVTVAGTLPLSYQWRKDAVALSEGGNYSGVRTPTLTLANVQAADAGAYSVTVSNQFGAVTSMSAMLQIDTTRLAEALDAPLLNWITGGDAPWNGLSTVTQDGVDAGQSGIIEDQAESWLETSVTGPGTLAFSWRVSSEAGYDFLEFYLDGVLQSGRISGATAWQRRTNNIPAGSHRLRWRYIKDAGTIGGQDSGWLDMVQYLPTYSPPTIIVNDASFGVRTNRFGFSLSGIAGQTVVIEGSSNLVSWLALVTNTFSQGPLYFSDPEPATLQPRFYRARVQ